MSTIIGLILTYQYLIILPMAILEGPFLAVLLGYLIYAGYVNLYITFILLLLGDIIPDLFYYRLGRYGNEKILESKYFSNSEKTVVSLNILKNMWHNHTKKTMFFGKLAYVASIPIIISAGIAKLPLKKFILTSLPVGIFQISVLLLLGYHLGTSYELASRYIKYPSMILAVLILLMIVLYVLFFKKFTKSLNK